MIIIQNNDIAKVIKGIMINVGINYVTEELYELIKGHKDISQVIKETEQVIVNDVKVVVEEIKKVFKQKEATTTLAPEATK